MRKFSTLLSTGLVALTLASCSKESYSFRQSAGAYHGSTASHVISTPVEESEVSVAPTAKELTASVSDAPAVATTKASAPKAARTYAAYMQKTSATAKEVAPTVSEVKAAKATVKAMHKAVKKAHVTAPNDEGKSQIVAALLCFFLGGLGIHDFYLGYIGKGILQIFLSIILIGFILVLIDLVRILTGSLKPKNGDYTKKL